MPATCARTAEAPPWLDATLYPSGKTKLLTEQRNIPCQELLFFSELAPASYTLCLSASAGAGGLAGPVLAACSATVSAGTVVEASCAAASTCPVP